MNQPRNHQTQFIAVGVGGLKLCPNFQIKCGGKLVAIDHVHELWIVRPIGVFRLDSGGFGITRRHIDKRAVKAGNDFTAANGKLDRVTLARGYRTPPRQSACLYSARQPCRRFSPAFMSARPFQQVELLIRFGRRAARTPYERLGAAGLVRGLATSPSRCALLRASLRARRIASPAFRALFSDGFS